MQLSAEQGLTPLICDPDILRVPWRHNSLRQGIMSHEEPGQPLNKYT